jgi:hypothetical protein
MALHLWHTRVKETIEDIGCMNMIKWILTCIMDGLTTKETMERVLIAIVIGCILSGVFCVCDLEMSEEAWFYVFSALSQTLAAFIAFGGMVLVFCLNIEEDGEKRDKLIKDMNTPYSLMITSIVFSIILLTVGQIDNLPSWITHDLFKPLKYAIAFSTIIVGIFGMIRGPGDMIWGSRHSKMSPPRTNIE